MVSNLFKSKILIEVFFLGFLILSMISCGEERLEEGDPPMSEAQFVDLFSELQLIEAHLNEPRVNQALVKDSAKYYYKEVLERYHLTQRELNAVLHFYGSNAGLMAQIYEKTHLKLSEMEAKLADVTIEHVRMDIIGRHALAEVIAGSSIASEFVSDTTLSKEQWKDSLFVYFLRNPEALSLKNINQASFQRSYINASINLHGFVALKNEVAQKLKK